MSRFASSVKFCRINSETFRSRRWGEMRADPNFVPSCAIFFGKLRNRKPEEKCRSVGEFAFGANAAAMGEHDVFGDGQPEAGASRFTGARFIDTIETFEEARQVLGRNPGAEIAHEEFYCAGGGAGAQDDFSASGAVFKGIVDQVGKNLVNGFAVGQHARQILDR